MAVLNDIREKSPKFIITGAAVIFILLIVFDWGLDLSGRRGRSVLNDSGVLGKVNGKEVDFKVFSETVRQAVENQKKQNGTDVDEEMERQIRSQVWEQTVNDMLIQQEIDRLGITVTDQEVRDVVMGPNPPEFLTRLFRDSAGTFHQDAYYRAMSDPQAKQDWIKIEDVIREQQKRKKLQSLLLATVQVSEGEIQQEFINRNVTMDAEFVLVDVNKLVPDNSVTVTDDDLKKVYNEHASEFKAKASRKVKYVIFNQIPSPEDTEAVVNDESKLLDQVKSGQMDFVELAKTYSENPVTETFFNCGQLTSVKESAIAKAKKGEIVGPIKDNDGVHLLKILDERQGKDEYIHASHILLNFVPGADSGKVLQRAKDLFKQARSGADFATLARENSQDGSAMKGGDLGWNKKGAWVKPFEEAAFKAHIGEVVGPVRTQFGWHIIKVTGRDKREVKIADLVMKVRASSQSVDASNQRAQDFQYLAKDEGFEKAAENSKYEVRETPEFTKMGSIPGIGSNDIISNFAFTSKVGTISEPLAVRGGVAVFKVSAIREEGVRSLDEVKNLVRMMALREMKMEKIRDQVDTFYKKLSPSTDLLAAAQSNPKLLAMRTGPFKAVEAPAGVGRDLKFIGTAQALNVGQLSTPIEGDRGFYIIKMMDKSPFNQSTYNAEHDAIRQQLLQEKEGRMMSEWQLELREKATIVDHRETYYK
ncbi:MAG TPA: peptidylprolyl isomerase [Bacteroidota bacterium]|nr:peptidylprolyl isomerase [Bacteroidota bacterium]